MTQYFDDFRSYSTGSLPSEWAEDSTAWTHGTWTVETAGYDKCLYDNASAASLGFCSLVAAQSDSSADVDIVARAAMSGTIGSTTDHFHVVCRWNADVDCYYFRLRSNGLAIGKYVNNTKTALATYSGTYSTNTFYWYRFVVSGSSLKGKIWTGSRNDEPGGKNSDSDWNIDTTDSAVTAAGWLGVGNASAQDIYLDVFGAGMGGDFAPDMKNPSSLLCLGAG